VLVDVARGLALIGMIAFHLTRDLELFEVIPARTTLAGFWFLFARLIAGTFMLLVGISLVLAHGNGIRWVAFAKRAGILFLAAFAVSAATYAAMPERFVYFGILHAILFASVAGLFLVRAPAWVSCLAAGAVIAVWFTFGQSLPFDPWLGWTGLAARPRPSLDLIPVIPWLALTFLGIALARVITLSPLKRSHSRVELALAWLGRHSLTVYLLHQPLLIGTIWLIVHYVGAG
jgi:uncharacterized membrane protein